VIVDAACNDVGVAICRSIRSSFVDLRLLMLCDELSNELAMQIAAVGVDCVVARSASIDSLCETISLLASPSGARAKGERETAPAGPIDHSHLTTKEIEILFYLANGETNKTIAGRLRTGEAAVKAHVKTLLRKLLLANRTQAAIWAVQHGYRWRQEDIVPNGAGGPDGYIVPLG